MWITLNQKLVNSSICALTLARYRNIKVAQNFSRKFGHLERERIQENYSFNVSDEENGIVTFTDTFRMTHLVQALQERWYQSGLGQHEAGSVWYLSVYDRKEKTLGKWTRPMILDTALISRKMRFLLQIIIIPYFLYWFYLRMIHCYWVYGTNCLLRGKKERAGQVELSIYR